MTSSLDVRFRVSKSYHKAAAVVLDLGTRWTRIGLAGEAHPRHTIPTPPSVSHLPSPTSPLPSPSSLSTLRSHYLHHLQPYLRHLFFHLLLVNPRDRRCLILEPPFLPLPYKLALLSSLLSLHCPAVAFLSSFTAALASTPHPHATVVDIGWAETRVCAVTDHTLPLLPYLLTSPIAISSLTSTLRSLTLPPSPSPSPTPGPHDDDRQWEELLARTAYLEPSSFNPGPDPSPTRFILQPPSPSYLHASSSAFLPTPTSSSSLLSPSPSPSLTSPLTVTVPPAARRLAESTFLDGPSSLPALILGHLHALPIDLRRPLSVVLLTGGGSQLPGLGQAVQAGLEREGGRGGRG